jgi:ABC-type lipoprotein export system ATPase subunit
MISVQNLSKTFPGLSEPVIKGITFEIQNGDFISLVGRSGSGKSTLLNLISSLDRNYEGDILYDNKSIKNFNIEEIHHLRNIEIGFVFQFHYLLGELTALENILLPSRKNNQLKEKEELAFWLLKEVGLEGKEHRLPSKLSGGEQQRVAIARSLIMKPQYVFADEPTGNLDTASGDMVISLFEKFNKELGTTIVYVTHDLEFAKRAKTKIQIINGILEKH